MNNVLIASDTLDKGEVVPANVNSLGVQFLFNVNMLLNFKTRLVADEHRSNDPISTTYSVMVSS